MTRNQPLEYIALSNLMGIEDVVISQIPYSERHEGKSYYVLNVWRPSFGDFTDRLTFIERIKTIFNIIFTGKAVSGDIILDKDQILKLSSWAYNHGEDY